MALRQFEGPDGEQWQVWLVKPTSSYTPSFRPAERRMRNDPPPAGERRINSTDARMLEINPHLEQGWLCFECESEKRRLLPVPQDWANCPDAKLHDYLQQAKKVQRNLTESSSASTNGTSSRRN